MAAGKGIQIVVGTDYNDRDLKRAQRDLSNLSRTQKSAVGPMGKLAAGAKNQLTPGFAAMGAAAAAAGAAIAAMAVQLAVDGVRAAAEEEQALAKLQTALNNVDQGFALNQVEGFIDSMQRATGVADDQLRPALQTLVTATGDAVKAQDLLALALDISVGTGKDLTAVASALGKAANGQFTQINRLTNGALNPSVLATRDLALITQELATLYGGQAQANAQTFSGKMARLKIAFDELLESFGQGFIDGFTEGAEVTENLGEAFRAAEPGMQEFGKTLGEMGRLFSYVSPYIDDVVSLFKYAVPSALTAAAAAFPPLAPLVAGLGGHFMGTKEAVDAYAESGDRASRTMSGTVLAALQTTSEGLSVVEEEAADAEDALKQLNDEMKTFFGFVDQRDSIRGYQDSIDELRKSLKENGKTFDTNTEKGRNNEAALDGVFESALKVAEGQATAAQKIKTMEDASREANAQLDKSGMSDGARARLLQPFDDAISKFRTANTQLGNLKAAMEAIPENINVTVTTTYVTKNSESKPPHERASGGIVTGPGTSTSDSIPTLLSNGEFVIRAASVRKFGTGLFDALNRGVDPLREMRGAGSPRQASGFTINGGITVNSVAGERAETSLPRALRRMSYLAGV